jgi:SNF2 family DNA or RNA helicase
MNDNDRDDYNDKETNAYRVPYLPVDSPMAITPTNFRIQLYNHQRRTLYRLLQIEATGIQTFCFGGHYDMEYETKGGCICDSVGLGKTATILSMICSEPRNYNVGANIFIMAPHLIAQWSNECKKFIKDNEVEVISLHRYISMPTNKISNRSIVLCSVDDVLESQNYYYDFRKLFDDGRRVYNTNSEEDKAFVQRCRKNACFVSGAYKGKVWVTELHMPKKPHRRVFLEEVQDLVEIGSISTNCFIQLTREAQNVWLISATPFPKGDSSAQANNEILGIKRRRVMASVYGIDRAFEELKRKLYIRNPETVRNDVIAQTIPVTEEYYNINITPIERALYENEYYQAEINDIERKGLWNKSYLNARQVLCNPKVCEHIVDLLTSDGTMSKAFLTNRTLTEILGFIKTKIHRNKQIMEATKKESDIVLRATSNSVSIIRAILLMNRTLQANYENASEDGILTIRQCFERDNMIRLGLDKYFNSPDVPFRGIASHIYGKNDDKRNPTRSAITCVLYGQEAIMNYLIMNCNIRSEKEHFYSIMSNNFNNTKVINDQINANMEILLKEYEKLYVSIYPIITDNNVNNFGSKIANLLVYLNDSKIDNVVPKTIIFSMYDDFLALVSHALNDSGFNHSIFKNDSYETRAKSLSSFTDDDSVTILLLSSMTSSSGINLQVASSLIFLDPVGNSRSQGSSLEQQAIGRIVRMGQNKAVKIIRFAVNETCERFYYEKVMSHRQNRLSKVLSSDRSDNYVSSTYNIIPNSNIHNNDDNDDDNEDDNIEIQQELSLDEVLKRRFEEATKKNEVVNLIDSDDEDTKTLEAPPPPPPSSSSSSSSSRLILEPPSSSLVSPSPQPPSLSSMESTFMEIEPEVSTSYLKTKKSSILSQSDSSEALQTLEPTTSSSTLGVVVAITPSTENDECRKRRIDNQLGIEKKKKILADKIRKLKENLQILDQELLELEKENINVN